MPLMMITFIRAVASPNQHGWIRAKSRCGATSRRARRACLLARSPARSFVHTPNHTPSVAAETAAVTIGALCCQSVPLMVWPAEDAGVG